MPDEREPVDLKALAMERLDHCPDKKLALLWGDLLRAIDEGRQPSSNVGQGMRALALLHAQTLSYLEDLSGELRYRLECLEHTVGLSYSTDGQTRRFPPSGESAPTSDPDRPNLATRPARLESRLGM